MYGYTITDGAIIGKAGRPLKTYTRKGRAYVKLYYNGKHHTHSVAHVIACIANDIDLARARCIHAHHVDGQRWNDWAPGNIEPMCRIEHMAIHGLI